VRAAIDGARDAGVGAVLVNDSHSAMRNLLWDELPDDVRVVSGGFQGVPLIDQHRMIYAAVDPALKDGRLHAIQIKTETRG